MNLSEAIVVRLRNYPQSNEAEFLATVTHPDDRAAVDAILRETAGLPMDWGTKTLVQLGDEVQRLMRERHPELTDEALRKLGNYFTYLMK